jgi:hypothetical protein
MAPDLSLYDLRHMTDQVLGRIDKAGMIASSLCAMHCVVSPIVLVVLSMHGLRSHLNQEAEWLFVGVSLTLGIVGLSSSCISIHRRTTALVVFGAGAALIFLGRLLLSSGDLEPVLAVVGALMMAAAHATNRFLCKTCPRPNRCTASHVQRKPS